MYSCNECVLLIWALSKIISTSFFLSPFFSLPLFHFLLFFSLPFTFIHSWQAWDLSWYQSFHLHFSAALFIFFVQRFLMVLHFLSSPFFPYFIHFFSFRDLSWFSIFFHLHFSAALFLFFIICFPKKIKTQICFARGFRHFSAPQILALAYSLL